MAFAMSALGDIEDIRNPNAHAFNVANTIIVRNMKNRSAAGYKPVDQ